MTWEYELIIRSISDLRDYFASDHYWRLWRIPFPNILIYGNNDYAEYALNELLRNKSLVLMEITADEIINSPGRVVSKLNELYEVDRVKKNRQCGGTVIILHEDAIEAIDNDSDLYVRFSDLSRRGTQCGIAIIAITNGHISSLILKSTGFFICQKKNRNKLNQYLLELPLFQLRMIIDLLIVEDMPIKLFGILLKKASIDSDNMTEKVFNKLGYPKNWLDKH